MTDLPDTKARFKQYGLWLLEYTGRVTLFWVILVLVDVLIHQI